MPCSSPRILKNELGTQLNQPRCFRAFHLSKSRSQISDISVNRQRPKELSMVECVKTFHSKLQRLRFRHTHIFHERNIEVIQSGPIEETPSRRAWSPQGILAKLRSIKIRTSIARVVSDVESAASIVRFINTKIVNAVGLGSNQRIVAKVNQGHRQS